MSIPSPVKKLLARLARRKLWVGLFALLLTLLWVVPVIAANDSPTAPLDTTSITLSIAIFFAKTTLTMVTTLMQLSFFVLDFIIEIAGYNDYLNSPAVVVGWTMVRDVANMFFVVVLLIIAFGTILGLEQYEWKKMLAKLVFAAVFVNFSNLICGIAIDAAQVFMTTFVNGIAATAGGNLIQAFKIQSMIEFAKNTAANSPENMSDPIGVIGAAVAATIFACMLLGMLAAYLIMLMIRMLTLWTLVVLSPLAFITALVPQTQKFATQWWSEFGNNVASGPVVVFFLWLAFVTVGDGAIHDNISAGSTQPMDDGTQTEANGYLSTNASDEKTAGVLAILEWSNMATFFIGIGMLIVGLKVTNQLGAQGADIIAKGAELGKKAGAVLSGVATARWAVGKGVETGAGLVKGAGELVGKGAKEAAWYLARGEKIKRWGQRQVDMFHAWRLDTGYRPKLKRDEKTGEILYDEKTGKAMYELDKDKNVIMEEVKRGTAQRFFHWLARGDIESEKMLKKTQNFAQNRRELLEKRTSGVPKGWFMREDENVDALDRIEQGMLAGEKARSEAKTKEYQAIGRRAVTSNARMKDGVWQKDKPTVIEMIAAHEWGAERGEAILARGKAQARQKYVEGRGGNVLDIIQGAEAGKAAAEGFVSNLKDGKLRDAFAKAGEAIENIISDAEMNPKKIETALAEAAKGNAYIASLRQGHLLAETSREKRISERQAMDAAYDAAVGISQGSRTPSSALSEEVEKALKEYSGMERTQAQKMAADRMAFLSQKRKEQGGALSLRDTIALHAAIGAVDTEAWNDDVNDHIFSMIQDLESGKLEAGSLEHTKALGMKAMADSLGWEYGMEEGKIKIKTPYGRKMSSQMQNMACFGGDVEAVRAHDIVAAFKDADETGATSYDDAVEEVARLNQLGMSVEDFFKRLGQAQDFLQTAARKFTQDAYGNWHYESAHNQQFDTKLRGGMLRPFTPNEAAEETKADLAKKTFSELGKAQIHSMVDLDLNGAHLPAKILEDFYRVVFKGMSEEYQMSYLNPRTAGKLYAHTAGEDMEKDGEGYAKFGGKHVKDVYGSGADGSNERGEFLIENYIMPALLGQHKAFLIGLRKNFDHLSSDDINHGKIKLNIDGSNFGHIEDLEELEKKILDSEKLSARIGQKNLSRLKELVKSIKSLGAGIGKGVPIGAKK